MKKATQLTSIATLLPLAGASASINAYSATVLLDDAGDTWYLDGSSSGTALIVKNFGSGTSFLTPQTGVAVLVDSGPGGKVSKLSAGSSSVSSGAAFNGFALSAGFIGNSYANYADWRDFTLNAPGYFGFSFDNNDTTNYGWAEITRRQDVGDYNWEITQWAYDDSGAAIQVGAVPEPAQAAKMLGLLALGAAGLSRYRRRAA